jgi:hypothetical protein
MKGEIEEEQKHALKLWLEVRLYCDNLFPTCWCNQRIPNSTPSYEPADAFTVRLFLKGGRVRNEFLLDVMP